MLVSRCREAKATKGLGLGMPWLSMHHNANNKVGMKTRTTALMAKFGITTIPALVLLDKNGCVICVEGCGMCDADPEGLAFPWREEPKVGLGARAAVNFDLPPTKQPKQPATPSVNLTCKPITKQQFCTETGSCFHGASTGGHRRGGRRLASHPSSPARSKWRQAA